ncbi:UvrD-helicase domain-containing protein [Flavihumibacter profundi]|uniref:UvrD-helicase domain-containing protein n=1 Tax=Flavihumibacter profundi TaxID=2716883 RepID=UPI001CC5DA88|nr:UvrD-helicase domain-containing protein [Flavihumibacter profundi]MBZ5859071.1 UvrD-helicase domain-containing protein [Flavihumibacter profundi]
MPLTPSSRPLHIYRASAGSGKTFLLAAEYLCLIFGQPDKYREILAVTFTNKATEEMKHRILEELRQLALGKETEYRKIIIERYPGLTGDGLLARQADLAYRTILHDYAKFSVTTIDSFVQQVIRSFAYEIGLDAGYELQLNQDLVKQDLADRLFELLETNDELLQWIKRLAIERIENGKSWDFSDEMLNFAGEIFKERFYLFEANMRNLEHPADSFEALRKRLQLQVENLENPMSAFGARALAILATAGLTTEDFPYGKSGFANYFNNLQQKKEVAPGTRVLAVLDTPESWVTKKTNQDTRSRIERIYPELNDLLNKAVSLYREHALNYHTAKAVLQQLNNLNLLRLLAEQLAGYRRDNNALLMSDTQQLLRELVRDNDAPFIYEKTGNRYQHFLLDEFQDTSTFQWENFRPLVEQSVSTGQFNLIVGDVKQSIYRWRNGDWRLLQEQVRKDIGDYNVQPETLKENYRSNKLVIDFNNFLFQAAPALLQQHFNNEMNTVDNAAIHNRLEKNGYYTIIQEAYADAFQQAPANAAEGGVVDIRFFEKEDSRSPNSWRPSAEAWLCELIEKLILEKGIDPARITLLTRGNRDARYLIDLLLQYQQTPASKCSYGLVSTDALVVNASPAIQLLLSALKFLINEKDSLSLVELVQANAMRLQLGLSNQDWYRAEINHALQQLPEAFRFRRKYLLQTGLYECVEELISIFSIDEWTSEQAYTLAFRDLVNSFSGKGKADIRGFLQWWEVEGQEKALPMSSALNAIQVMTIHKSKGLAFDVVIIPYADWKLVNEGGLLWCEWQDPAEGITILPVNITSSLARTSFAYEYFEELLMSRMDSLNLLYVALTRTRQAMYIMAPKPSTKKNDDGGMSVIGDLLWQSIKGTDNILVNFENDRMIIDGDIQPRKDAGKEKATIAILPVSTHSSLITDLREPAKHELILQSASSAQQMIGQLAHLVLSRVSALADLDMEIQKMELEGLLTSAHSGQVKETVQQALQNPQLSAWFNGNFITLNEKAILLKGGAIRRPDKVLVGEGETILLDFKFTQQASPSHGKQLKQYQDLLEEMGYHGVRSFIYYGYNQALVPLAQLSAEQGNLFEN